MLNTSELERMDVKGFRINFREIDLDRDEIYKFANNPNINNGKVNKTEINGRICGFKI